MKKAFALLLVCSMLSVFLSCSKDTTVIEESVEEITQARQLTQDEILELQKQFDDMEFQGNTCNCELTIVNVTFANPSGFATHDINVKIEDLTTGTPALFQGACNPICTPPPATFTTWATPQEMPDIYGFISPVPKYSKFLTELSGVALDVSACINLTNYDTAIMTYYISCWEPGDGNCGWSSKWHTMDITSSTFELDNWTLGGDCGCFPKKSKKGI